MMSIDYEAIDEIMECKHEKYVPLGHETVKCEKCKMIFTIGEAIGNLQLLFAAANAREEQAEENLAWVLQNYCDECGYDPEICRGTQPDVKCAVRALDDSKGAQIIAENKRMREALRQIAHNDCRERVCDEKKECIDCIESLAKAALEVPDDLR